MTTCWSDIANDRPSFKSLAAKLGGGGGGGGNVGEGKDAAVDDWESKFDETAAWSTEMYNFKPCGFDMSTKHIHAGLRDLEGKIRMSVGFPDLRVLQLF